MLQTSAPGRTDQLTPSLCHATSGEPRAVAGHRHKIGLLALPLTQSSNTKIESRGIKYETCKAVFYAELRSCVKAEVAVQMAFCVDCKTATLKRKTHTIYKNKTI